MKFLCAILWFGFLGVATSSDCPTRKTQSKLICYYSKLQHLDSCKCSHVILPPNSDVKNIQRIRENFKGVKILVTVNEFNQGLVDLLKTTKIDGLEINLRKLDTKNDINDFISTIRNKLGSDLSIVISIPAKTETLAKFYDFKTLSKSTDLFILQTGFLGASKNLTFHPSRLSGLWDMQNTDSVVDLVSGLGAPLSKLIITAPVQAFKFKLQSEKHTAPGSPALEIQSITRNELCKIMKNGQNWTLERDQDQTGPYIFSKNEWIAFEDSISIDIKAKYSRIRGLAGLALKDLTQDGTKCEISLLESAFNGLNKQARAPRGAVLHSLEREILETPIRPLDSIQVSPYRISRIIDVEGNVHVIRKDTRTEFECSRQGYFVHPRSCGRFYRCVKFDQLSDEFSVFEFDCPAGLAFDSRVEVCVWPGSLPHASACSGSSEIAPVPRERFVCPNEPGYYADPENCRWFFACLDHGKSPLSAYEFRCPFGLVYDESRLLCEWPWLVPKCGNGYAVASQVVYGGSSIALDQYDGLGVLGVTRLGGLHGPLQEPQIYSNVGLQGNGQLSLKATQTLQNAGLLQTQNIGSATLHGSGLEYSRTGGSSQGLGLGYVGLQNSQIYNLGSNLAQNGNIQQSGGNTQGSGLEYSHGTVYSNLGLENSEIYGSNLAQIQQSQGSGLQYSDGISSNLGLQRGEIYGSKLAQNNNQQSGASIQDSGLQYSHGIVTSNSGLQSGEIYGSKLAQDGNQQAGASIQGSGLQYSHGIITSNSGLQSGEIYGSDEAQNGNIQQSGGSIQGSRLQYSLGTSNFGLQSSGIHRSNIAQAATLNTNLYQSTADQNDVRGTTFLEYGSKLNYQTDSQGAQLINGLADNVNAKSTIEYHGTTGSDSYGTGTNGKINIVGGGYSAVGLSGDNIQITNYGEDSNVVTHVTQSPISVSTISAIPTVTSVPVPSIKTVTGFESYQGGVVANVPELQYKVTPHGATGFANISTSFVASRQDGYQYPKPTVAFVEEPRQTGTIVKQTLPVVVSTTQRPLEVVQPVITSYQQPISNSYIHQVQEKVNLQPVITAYQKPATFIASTPTEKINQPTYTIQNQETFVGYDYPKPSIKFEEKAVNTGSSYSYQNVQPVVTTYNVPSSTRKPVYVSSTPATVLKQEVVQPEIEINSYNVPTSTVRPVVVQQPQVYITSTPATIKQAFSYQKQEIVQPQIQVSSYNVPASTAKPVVVQQPQVYVASTPATVPVVHQQQSFINFQNHQVQPQVQLTSYNVPSSTVKPIVVQQPQVYVSSTPATVPIVKQAVSYQKVVQPQIQFTSYNVPVSTAKPVVVQQPQVYVSSTPANVKQNIISSFSISSNNQGYYYEKPKVTFEEQPIVSYRQPTQKPAVSSYSYKNILQTAVGYQYPQPATSVEEVPASVTRLYQQPIVASYNYVAPSTVKPAILLQKQQPVVTSYNYQTPSTIRPEILIQKQTPVVTSYSYQTPSTVKLQQQPVVTSYNYEVPTVKQTTYQAPSTSKPTVFIQSSTPKTALFLPQQPDVVTSYTVKPVITRKQPSVISSYSFNLQSQEDKEFNGYDYSRPIIPFEEPQPVITYENREPVREEQFIKKTAYVTGQAQQEPKSVIVENYQLPTQQVSTTPRYEYNQEYSQDSGYVYQQPEVQFEEQPRVYQQQVVTTRRPTIQYNLIQSTPKPTFLSTVRNIVASEQPWTYYDSRLTSTLKPISYSTPVTVTTSKPISRYSFGSLAKEYEISQNNQEYVIPEVSTVRSTTYQPIEVTPSRDYLPVTTSRPAKISSLGKVIENYVASEPTQEYLPVITSTVEPSREYLPVKTRVRITTTPSSLGSTLRPVKIVKVTRPKTIVKQNDFHPLLSAKLGAQCTCVSNSVKLRKRPLKIIIQEDDDDDGYVVDDNPGVVVENYESQRIEATPEVYIKSTTVTPSTTSYVRTQPVSSTLAPEDISSDSVVVNSLADGKSNIQTGKFDRYGPGGWRSRNEKLQGTIDCQRAGLFRHPSQCNKFYACRWDCTKNRYTLHIFNCPVHLTFDNNLGACNWPSQGPACLENTLLPSD